MSEAAVVSFGSALWQASRPKTLVATAVPVIVAGALAFHEDHTLRLGLLIFVLLSAGFIQIGTNFINDALDFLKGADTHERFGPARATQMGWLSPKMVLGLGATCFALAALCGIPLVMRGGTPILAIGLVSILMGYCYTGGPYPLAYKGLGDVFVLIFFGWIAVGGTYYLLTGAWNLSAFVAGTQVGLLGTVLIAINNLRDQKMDAAVGKHTMAVRLGRFAHWEVTFLVVATFALCFYWVTEGLWKVALYPCLVLPFALQLDKHLKITVQGPLYNIYLARAAKIQLGFGALMALGFYLS
jgi:1,4-dihydroxy-2-naphthoate polyprenyltransferase